MCTCSRTPDRVARSACRTTASPLARCGRVTDASSITRKGDGLFAVSVNPTCELSPAAPRLLFKKQIAAFDAAPDGRFLIIEDLPSESLSSPVAVIINWFSELDARLQSRRDEDCMLKKGATT